MIRKQSETLITTLSENEFDMAQETNFMIGPDSKHFAWIRRSVGEQYVVMDNKPHRKYEKVNVLGFSPDGLRLAYIGSSAGRDYLNIDDIEYGPYNTLYCDFSPDSLHFACAVIDGAQHFAVIDGQRQEPCAAIMEHTPVFSSDNRRIAYGFSDGTAWYVHVDDEIQGPFDRIGHLFFSNDSTKIAYKAISEGKEFMVVNGIPQREFDNVDNPHFSQDDTLLVYSVRSGGKWMVNINGSLGKPYDDLYIGDWSISKVGNRIAYRGKRGKEWYLVLDEIEHGPFDGIAEDSIQFSPDGRRIAFVAGTYRKKLGIPIGRDNFIVLDGKPGPVYSETSTVDFSPDSARYSYIAKRKGEEFIVLDGIELGPYQKAGNFTYPFSQDGRRTAYPIFENNQIYVIADGNRYGPYKNLGAIEFSPDSRLLAFTVRIDKHVTVVVNGQPGAMYDELLALKFDSPCQFHYAAKRGEDFLFIEETVEL